MIKYITFGISISFISWIVGILFNSLLLKTEYYKKLSNLNFIEGKRLNKMIGIAYVKWVVKNTFFKFFNPQIKVQNKNTDLMNLRKEMTLAEISHLIAFVFVTIVAVYKGFSQGFLAGLMIMLANVLMNLYPSLLQQENKRRIDQLMKRQGRRVLFYAAIIFWGTACQQKADPKQEEKMILACLEAETKAWIDRDTVAWLNCYAQLPVSSQVWNNRNGTWDGNRGWDHVLTQNMKDFRANRKPRTDKFEASNYQIQMCGEDWAWVTFDQVIRRDGGREFKNFESRVMTKIKGEWKLVGNASLWDYSKTSNIGDQLKGQSGKVIRHESATGSSDWLIETNLFEKTMMLYPIGLPDALKKEGLDIRFDGEFLYGKHLLYKPGADKKPVPDEAIHYVRIDAVL